VHADLLDSAVKLACSGSGGVPPTQADLRRAASTAYYAAFHFVMAQCADLLTCDPGGVSLSRAWYQVYRSIKHADVRTACNEAVVAAYGFPKEVREFAALYPSLRRLREEADYDPKLGALIPQHVMAKITEVDYAIGQFLCAAESHRRAFVILVAVKRPSS
jgi:hypothetical protein